MIWRERFPYAPNSGNRSLTSGSYTYLVRTNFSSGVIQRAFDFPLLYAGVRVGLFKDIRLGLT